MADTPIECPCEVSESFFCLVFNKRMNPTLAELCQTDPKYRAKWMRQALLQPSIIHQTPLQQAARKLERLLNPGKGCGGCNKQTREQVVTAQQQQLLEDVLNGTGPGSQLWHLFSRLGIQHTAECSCVLLADIMNSLGPQGCREQRAKLLKLMYKNKKRYGWHDTLKAAKNLIVLGWLFKINPMDPLSSLLDEAIKLSEQVECQSPGNTA